MSKQVSVIDPCNPSSHSKNSRKWLVHDTPGFHAWVHGPDKPGEKGPMHKHTADQVFSCVKGEATYHFPDRTSEKLTPGMMIVIPEGQVYQIENSGNDDLILTGTRAESAGNPSLSPDDDIVSRKARRDAEARSRSASGH